MTAGEILSVSICKLVEGKGAKMPGFLSQLCHFQPVGPQTGPLNPQA